MDKKALSVVFDVKRFHHYLFGRSFFIASDHKPLQHLNEGQSIPTMISARLQRWAFMLSAYQYTISYHFGNKLANTDALSRLPLLEAPDSIPLLREINLPAENGAIFPNYSRSGEMMDQLRPS